MIVKEVRLSDFAEIDLILDRPDGRYGFEIKSSENRRPKAVD